MPTEVQIYKDGTVVAADIADDTITAGKLSTGHPNWDTAGNLTATSFVKTNGTSSQYLMADGTTTTTFFATGTILLFYQASAPTGWTKVTTQDNKALRVVSETGGGSGGTTAFTTVFASRTDIPLLQHSHGITEPNSGQGHQHTEHSAQPDRGTSNGGGRDGASEYFNRTTAFATTGITINNAGTASPTMDFAVQYIDVILCSKN
jgi:hypothetical protein